LLPKHYKWGGEVTKYLNSCVFGLFVQELQKSNFTKIVSFVLEALQMGRGSNEIFELIVFQV
jgi:hypothetical protein